MIDYFNPPNSIWPNGMKDDPDGYAVFYPLGTNKVDISTVTWPEGDTLISPFVYQNDELVGFVDTKAITVSGTATTTMNYSHIEADFASISEGKLTVNAPNATVKKFKWGEFFDFVIIDFATADQKTIDTVRTAKRVVDNELYDAEGGLIGTIDTSKIKVGGIFDYAELRLDGLFCNNDILSGTERGIILSEFNSDLSSLSDGSLMFGACNNLTTFNSDLSNLTNGFMMFASCTNLTTFTSDLSNLTNCADMFADCYNLTSFNADLSSLTNGSMMFEGCYSLTSFSSNLSSLTNGYNMFSSCGVTSFDSDLSSLTNGDKMFQFCPGLTSFSSNLSSLTNGYMMFQGCSALTSFTSDLSSVTEGVWMFDRCSSLTSFSSDLSSLTDGNQMFARCTSLTSFSSDLPSLTGGGMMFLNCSALTTFNSDLSSFTGGGRMFEGCINLTSFTSDLPSLTYGVDMFNGCKLDAPSVKNIIDTINTSSKGLTLGMGCNNTTEDKNLFAQEVGYTDMTSLLAALQAKGWVVTTQYNGRPTITYGLRRPSEDTLPVFVKLKEVEETEDYADYTSIDGSKKYRLSWFHETTGSTDGYTQFNTLEEAIETLNIKPIEIN